MQLHIKWCCLVAPHAVFASFQGLVVVSYGCGGIWLQGGPALQIEGLHSVVSDEQYVKLATAEIIPPTQTFVSTKASQWQQYGHLQ